MTPQFAQYNEHIFTILRAAISAVDPVLAVRSHLQRKGAFIVAGEHIHDTRQGKVYLVSVGKAALAMAVSAADVLGQDLASGLVIVKRQEGVMPPPFVSQKPALRVLGSSHPVPDESSVQAAVAVQTLLKQTTPHDLVLCLISGGASSLLSKPIMPLGDWQALTKALLLSGCPIQELNTVRRQFDEVKGGGLARWAAPAHCVSLILSDVVGNPLPLIGSGPTVPGSDTLVDAVGVLRRYNVAARLETAVRQRIATALKARPQPIPFNVRRVRNFLVGDVAMAAKAAFAKATRLGYLAQILTTHLEGEAREVGRMAAAMARDLGAGHCLILGGETTVTVRGKGQGGRNLEVALAAAIGLADCPHAALVSFATDGEDGPTDCAGAMVSGATAVLAQKHGLSPQAYLQNNDSYTFFKRLKEKEPLHPSLIQTGPTGTNVNDIILIVAGK